MQLILTPSVWRVHQDYWYTRCQFSLRTKIDIPAHRRRLRHVVHVFHTVGDVIYHPALTFHDIHLWHWRYLWNWRLLVHVAQRRSVRQYCDMANLILQHWRNPVQRWRLRQLHWPVSACKFHCSTLTGNVQTRGSVTQAGHAQHWRSQHKKSRRTCTCMCTGAGGLANLTAEEQNLSTLCALGNARRKAASDHERNGGVLSTRR